MQDVSNDMDDLFKQAGEQYPLRINGEDWDKVLLRLQTANLPVPVATTAANRHWRKALWLLLLLPLALLYITHRHNAVRSVQPATTDTSNTAKAYIASGSNEPSSPGTQRGKQEDTRPQKATMHHPSPVAVPSVDRHRLNGGTPLSVVPVEPSLTENQTSAANFARINVLKNKKADAIGKANEPAILPDYTSSNIGQEAQPGSATGKRSADKIAEDELHAPAGNNDINEVEKQASGSLPRIEKENTVADTTAIKRGADSAVLKAATPTGRNTKLNKNEALPVRRLYGGLMGSFDLSTVKLQRINKTGYGVNLLAGYQFSKRLSVEAGVGFTSKKYYTIGQYFDKSRTGIPPESDILFTNGVCRMIEIPVALKYDFALQRKSHFFATAGLSSYLMKEEQYAYYAERNGWYYDASKSYKNSGANWLSVAGVSVGYEHYLNKKIALRIEPYAKMPLRGIGIAKLPIMSTGVSAGFTRTF